MVFLVASTIEPVKNSSSHGRGSAPKASNHSRKLAAIVPLLLTFSLTASVNTLWRHRELR